MSSLPIGKRLAYCELFKMTGKYLSRMRAFAPLPVRDSSKTTPLSLSISDGSSVAL